MNLATSSFANIKIFQNYKNEKENFFVSVFNYPKIIYGKFSLLEYKMTLLPLAYEFKKKSEFQKLKSLNNLFCL